MPLFNKAETDLIAYLSYRTAADYIMAVKRMKLAEKRIDLWEGSGKDMCLHFGCLEAVISEVVTNCEKHLDDREKRWLKEIEAHRQGVPSDSAPSPTDHPSVEQLKKINQERNLELIKEYFQRKEDARKAAYQRSKEFWEERRLRGALLPPDLLRKLIDQEKRLIDVDDDLF